MLGFGFAPQLQLKIKVHCQRSEVPVFVIVRMEESLAEEAVQSALRDAGHGGPWPNTPVAGTWLHQVRLPFRMVDPVVGVTCASPAFLRSMGQVAGSKD